MKLSGALRLLWDDIYLNILEQLASALKVPAAGPSPRIMYKEDWVVLLSELCPEKIRLSVVQDPTEYVLRVDSTRHSMVHPDEKKKRI